MLWGGRPDEWSYADWSVGIGQVAAKAVAKIPARESAMSFMVGGGGYWWVVRWIRWFDNGRRVRNAKKVERLLYLPKLPQHRGLAGSRLAGSQFQ